MTFYSIDSQNHSFHMDRSMPKVFQIVKDTLMKNPILVYPNLNNPYTLFMDASK